MPAATAAGRRRNRHENRRAGVRRAARLAVVYSNHMHSLPPCILALVFAGLLSSQAVGLHLHVNAHSESGGLHASHVHHADPDGHDHSDDIDVSLFEFGAAWSKILALPMPCVALLLATVWLVQGCSPAPAPVLSTRRRSRWRPPLRAPPATV